MQSTSSSQAATLNPSPPAPDSDPGDKISSEKEDDITGMCVLNPVGEPSFNELLINAVQDYPILYNNQKRAHDTIDRDQIWAEVAAKIDRGTSAQFTKKRWLQLRDRYRKEIKRSMSHNYTKRRKWSHFHLLTWLDPYLQGAVQYTNTNGDSSTLNTFEGVTRNNDFGGLLASLNQPLYDGNLSEAGFSDNYSDVKPEMSALQTILAVAEATAKLNNLRDADENKKSRISDLIESDEYEKSVQSKIFITPPDNATGDVTDEDGDDDDDDAGSIENLPGSLLRCSEIDSSDSEDENVGGRSVWRDGDLKVKLPDWKKGNKNETFHGTPTDFFEFFFDDELILHIVRETNRYGASKNVSLEVTKNEIKCFIGILILSGYITYPRRSMYWEHSRDSYHHLVADAMRKNRFEQILSCLHVANNKTLNTSDRFAKLRPICQRLNTNFSKYAPHVEHYSIDELMCEYQRRHGCKESDHGKQVSFGFKLWCAATTNGYIVWLDPYQGKAGDGRFETSLLQQLGLAGAVVATAALIIKKDCNSHFHLFFNNFFTSMRLMNFLTEMGVKGTGTIREYKLAGCPVLSESIIKKYARGTHETKVNRQNKVVVCRWHDNNVVTVCSNAISVFPMQKVARFSRKTKIRTKISQPNVIKVYNEHVGGVDRANQNLMKYRISIRGKKWYSSLITFLIDAAINNAWQLHRESVGGLDLLEFRRSIARTYLEKYKSKPAVTQPLSVELESKYDNTGHFVIPQPKQTRCRHCHQKASTRCEKCDVGLHVKCFKSYHTQ